MTAAETTVVTAIFLIITATTVVASNGAAQREEINAEATGLTDWLNVVQRAAQRTTGGCTVSFGGGTALANGSVLATVTPATCHPQASYRIEALRQGSRLAFSISGLPANTLLAFTPRGTVTVADELTLTLTLNQTNLSRCLRIAGTSGFLSTGSNNQGAACNDASFSQRI